MSPISPICQRGLILLPSEKLRHHHCGSLADTPIRPYAVTLLRRRHQGCIYLLVETDAGDQDLVSADLGDLPGDGL
jgi:hypothetical protein